jgi:hypothetical protein
MQWIATVEEYFVAVVTQLQQIFRLPETAFSNPYQILILHHKKLK